MISTNRFKPLAFFFLLVCCNAVCVQAEEPLNILFIGNSFTLGGPIPQVVQNIALSAGWPKPNVTNVSVGGQTLSYHSTSPDTLAAIDQGGWDFVVLQEYSTKATDNAGDPAGFKADATFLYNRVKASSPQAWIVLYETWARHENHSIYPNTFVDRDQMQTQVNTHYHDCAENYLPTHATFPIKTDVAIAPAGEAWHANYHDRNIMLHGSDLYHAGGAGQYLNGLAIYATIYHRRVIGLTPLLGVNATDATYLQSICDAITGETIIQIGSDPNPILDGDEIQVDFGNTQTVSAGWNTMAAADGTIAGAITSSNKMTSVSITLPVQFNGENSSGTTSPSGDAAIYPSQSTSDSFFGNDIPFSGRINPEAQLLISNLDPRLRYELTFFASRMGVSDNRQTRYTISGDPGSTQTLYLNPSNNTSTIARSQLITPTETGEIVIDILKGPANNNVTGFFYLGLLTLRAQKNPFQASDPRPAHQAIQVPNDSLLSWTAPTAIANPHYNIYWWTDPNMIHEQLDVSEPGVNPSDLEYGKTYFWRVDTIENASIVHEGQVWSFTVEQDAVTIIEQPQIQTVFSGETAIFTIVLEDQTGKIYRWGKIAEDSVITLLTDDGRITGSQSDTLTIRDVSLVDEQDYFCRITNNSGDFNSDAATLILKRILSHWPLDGTLDDISGGKQGTMMNRTPAFDTGLIEGALVLSGASDDWVTVGAVGVNANKPRTITGWIKATDENIPSWTGVFGFSHASSSNATFFDIERLGNQDNGYGLHQYNWEVAITDSLPVGEWIFVAASHDGETTRWYGNGVQIGEATRLLNTYDLWTMGKRADNDNLFTGLIDDIRLYNYALSSKEIAKLWTDVSGGYVCLAGPPLYDFNQDCRVDLADLAIFTAQWMDCTRYPECTNDI